MRKRGWKTLPEMVTKPRTISGKGGRRTLQIEVPMEGTGALWHFNVMFHHVYAPDDPTVLIQEKQQVLNVSAAQYILVQEELNIKQE